MLMLKNRTLFYKTEQMAFSLRACFNKILELVRVPGSVIDPLAVFNGLCDLQVS